MWLISIFLNALSLDFVEIRVGMPTKLRTAAVTRFTEAASTAQVLLTTYN
ncbi:hypothetical protein PENANT_c391G10154, partial [Penicillium antarcticum]